MCQKIPYNSKTEALDDAVAIRAQVRHFTKNLGKCKKSGRKLRAYPCRFCPAWHLTTTKK